MHIESGRVGTTSPKHPATEMENHMNRIIDHTCRNSTRPFAGVDLPVVRIDGKPRIILRYVITDLGLEPGGVLKTLKGKPWADLKLATAVDGSGHHTRMQTLSAAAFLIWISRLTYVPAEARVRLNAYQAEVHQALAAHSTTAFPN